MKKKKRLKLKLFYRDVVITGLRKQVQEQQKKLVVAAGLLGNEQRQLKEAKQTIDELRMTIDNIQKANNDLVTILKQKEDEIEILGSTTLDVRINGKLLNSEEDCGNVSTERLSDNECEL